eukprot:2187836-Lingulodinium_polyedra.AAC.1
MAWLRLVGVHQDGGRATIGRDAMLETRGENDAIVAHAPQEGEMACNGPLVNVSLCERHIN